LLFELDDGFALDVVDATLTVKFDESQENVLPLESYPSTATVNEC
jgi:hypothetical protein